MALDSVLGHQNEKTEKLKNGKSLWLEKQKYKK